MNSTFLICLITLWSLGFAYQVNEQDYLPSKLPLRPGDLLRSLDKPTTDAQVIAYPLQEAHKKPAERRVYLDENADPGADDYDKAYEDFVSKYFAQGKEDLESDEDEKSADVDDAVPFESSSDVEIDNPTPKKKSKKCKRVQIDDQKCVVCEDPNSNEKSKSCSYSSESKPNSYGFNKQRSSSNRSNDDDDDDDNDDESTEAAKSSKREANSKNQKTQPRRTSIKAYVPVVAKKDDDALKCTRKREDGMICYYCGTTTENTRECMADKNNPKKRRLDESSKKDSTKKVFKRMVTYSYKNDAEPKIRENTYSAFKE